jgi:ankyrin repeat protein
LDGQITQTNITSSTINSLSPNQVTDSGNTALHIEAKNNDWDMMQILIAFDGDLNLKNRQNQTLFDVANHYNYADLVNKINQNIFVEKTSLIEILSQVHNEKQVQEANPPTNDL